MGKKINLEKEFLEQQLYVEHKSIKQLSKELDISASVISQSMKEYGLKTNFEHNKDILTRDVLYQKYIVENKSVRNLAKELHCGRDWLRATLKEFNLLREASFDAQNDTREKLTYDLLYREYICEQNTIAGIAKKYNYKPKTVRRHLQKEGLYIPPKNLENLIDGNADVSKIQDDEKFIQLIESGKTPSDLAIYYGCSQDVIYRRKEKLGLSNPGMYHEISKQDLIKKYVDEQLSCEQIAEDYECSGGTVRNRLIEYGISIRKPCELTECEFSVEDLKEHLMNGLSYVAIAEIYNCSGSTVRNHVIKNKLEDLLKSNVSKDEYKIMKQLDELELPYINHERKILHGREIDFVINNIGIEVSPCFSHNVDFTFPGGKLKDKKYHKEKFEECIYEGIYLITQFDWMNKYELTHYLYNISKTVNTFDLFSNISNRKFRLSHAKTKEERKILFNLLCEKYYGNSSSLHLSFKNELYAMVGKNNTIAMIVMFVPCKNNDWKIFIARNTSIPFKEVHLMKRIIDRFVSDFSPSSLVITTTNDYCEYILFDKLGFSFVKNLPSKCRFVHKKNKKSCFPSRCHEIFPEVKGKSKEEIRDFMISKYYYRVYDCGYKVMKKEY